MLIIWFKVKKVETSYHRQMTKITRRNESKSVKRDILSWDCHSGADRQLLLIPANGGGIS